MPKPTINPDELRNRFRAAQRMPQLLEVRDMTRLALRQTSDSMDDGGDTGNGDGMAELQALFEQLKGLLSAIDDRITRTATLDDIERRAHGTPLRDGTDRDFQRQCCEFSLFRAAGHAIGLRGIDAGRELEVQNELAKRAKDSGRTLTGNVVMPYEALSVQIRHLSRQQLARYETRDLVGPIETRVIGSTQPPGTTGGSLIGTYTDPSQYIDVLRPSMAVRQAGARVISDLREFLRLPRMNSSATPGWFAENAAIPTSDETFDDIVLQPHHDGAIVTVTRNMLQQSNPEIEAIVRNDLALKLANDVDRAAIAGTGVAPQPLGIVTDGAVPSLTSAAFGYDTFPDVLEIVANNNALMGSLGWIGDTKLMANAMRLKDSYARPYGLDMLSLGYPMFWSNLAITNVTGPPAVTDPLIFGNWSDLIIGFWSELDVLVNPYSEAAFSTGNCDIRAAMTLDIAKRHALSFAWTQPSGLTVTGAAAAAPAAPSRRASA
jgi:HK97 family phage major capsid protein